MGSAKSKLERDVIEYADKGNLKGIKECIANGVNINYQKRTVNMKHNYVLYLYTLFLITIVMVFLVHYRMDGVPFTVYALKVIFLL